MTEPSDRRISHEASASSRQDPWIVLAHLLRPQGRKGELLAELLTDFPERFDSAGEARKRVFLAPPQFSGAAQQARLVEVLGHWLPVGKNQGRIVLHFKGINSINEAGPLAGLDVIVPASERLELDDDAAYISDLIGCTVVDVADSANPLIVGIVADVEFPTTSDGTRRLSEAAPLLVVATPAAEEVLVPFAKAFVVSIDLDGRRIEMSLPSGLVDINRL